MCFFAHVSNGIVLVLTSNYEAAPAAFLGAFVLEVMIKVLSLSILSTV